MRIVKAVDRMTIMCIDRRPKFWSSSGEFLGSHSQVRLICYAGKDGAPTFERKILLGKQKEDKTGSRYPAGIAVSLHHRETEVLTTETHRSQR